jgi:hypothetical protein
MARSIAAAALAGAVALPVGPAAAQEHAPFGTDVAADYATQLWSVMADAGMVGDGMIRTFPYEGTEPHGLMLETLYTTATLDGHTGELIVKRNYLPAGVTADQVLSDPETHLDSVTVMFRREEGYDPDNADWFWAKYLPDGTLDTNPAGMRLAGRVAKGADAGCIACHVEASGDDYLYTTDHIE